MQEPNCEVDIRHKVARKVVAKYSAVSAGASLVPIPGADLVADMYSMAKMLNAINAIYGLTPDQIDALNPGKKIIAANAIMAVGNQAIGKAVTSNLVMTLLKKMGKRVATKQFTKYVPIAGQAVALALAVTVMATVGEKHIRDCRQVSRKMLELSEPKKEI